MPTPLLTEIASALPKPCKEDIAAVFAAADPNLFAAKGRRVASSRVLTDTSRLYGLAAAFLTSATPRQQEALVGFSAELLAVAVHEALELDCAVDTFEANEKHDHGVREITAATLGDQWTVAMRQRDRAVKAMAPIAGEHKTREAELRAAVSTSETSDDLARSLRGLASLTRTWVADPELARIVKMTRMTVAYAVKLEAAAAQLVAAADAARTRMTYRVSQGDLDVLDGRNLYALKLIIDVFDEAHDEDPSVPRLIPLSVANVLKRKGSTRKGKGTAVDGGAKGAVGAGKGDDDDDDDNDDVDADSQGARG